MAFRVLATARSFCKSDGPHHAYLRDNDCELDLHPPDHPMSAAELAELVPGYDGLILGLDDCNADVIARADRLRVISRYGSGVDKVDVNAATARGIVVTNTPGVNRIAVAELTIGLMFCLARRIPQMVNNVRAGVWTRAQGWELYGKTLGLIGLGAIGREVAARAHALGMRVIANDPYSAGILDRNADLVDLETLLREAHHLAALRHHARNPNLINAERLALVRDGAYLVNTARGEAGRRGALYDALVGQAGRGGVGCLPQRGRRAARCWRSTTSCPRCTLRARLRSPCSGWRCWRRRTSWMCCAATFPAMPSTPSNRSETPPIKTLPDLV